jgi:attachment p12 family protein
MDVQWLLVIALVAVSAGYLLRRAWRTWWAKSGCGGSCGCDAPPVAKAEVTLIPSDQLRLRPQNRAGEK